MTLTLSLAPEPPNRSVDPRDYVEAIVLNARSSFGTAMKVLPRKRRDAIYAVYAFCRVVDDIADGDKSAEEKRALLASWRDEVHLVFNGQPRSAVGQALVEPVQDFDLDAEEFLLMIEGMEMDANGPIVAPDLDTLLAYTRRVAGSVGMLSIRIFGAWRGPQSDLFSLALADALQLTNIIRDVEEDADIHRLYLPSEYLASAGIDATPPAEVASHPNLPEVCRILGALARSRFEEARAHIPAHNRFRLFPALMMMGVYEGYLKELRRRDWQRQGGPVRFSSRKKALLSLRYALLPLPPLG